jgi:hypothetical protein
VCIMALSEYYSSDRRRTTWLERTDRVSQCCGKSYWQPLNQNILPLIFWAVEVI